MKGGELKWLPIPLDFWIPPDLQGAEIGWFVSLLIYSLRSERLGYIKVPNPAMLWRFAGALHPETFEKYGSKVLAHFERTIVHGSEVLFFPPLIATIEEQLCRLKGKRERISTTQKDIHNRCGFSSNLCLDFDVGSKKEKGEEKKSARSSAQNSGPCGRHADSGLTPWGTCWACYQEKYA